MIDHEVVERLLEKLYLGGGTPRNEERKKAREVAGLLEMIAGAIAQPAPRGKARTLVDAAAGHGYVGLCAAALLGWKKIVAVERDADRIERVRAAAAKLDDAIELETHVVSLGEGALPREADLVVALHACGPATDGVLADAVASDARWILCAPCCYGAAIDGWEAAIANADALRIPDDAGVRGRFLSSLVDAERLRRLASAGYEAQLIAFTAPTVTPHNLAFRARRGGRQLA